MNTNPLVRRILRPAIAATVAGVAAAAALGSAAIGSVPTGPAAADGGAPAVALGSFAVPGVHGSLLDEVQREVAAMKRSRYQHTTDVREATGEFYYDCSGFLDYALQRSSPGALRALPVDPGKARPLARDVVHHLQRVAGGAGGPWRSVAAVRDLRPGDVVSWLTPEDSDSLNTGHVMIVLQSPRPNPERPGGTAERS